MTHPNKKRLVVTVKDRCRVCYTCVRECPVKAIMIRNGQAEVIQERCIGCGNCVKVCSQGAKTYLDNRGETLRLIHDGEKVVACVAPSFAAEFMHLRDYRVLVGMLKRLGFYKVIEVAFGADMVSREYRKHLENSDRSYITSDCPALVNYVEMYCHSLVGSLAPIASPMVATARIARKKYGDDIKVVFIGPCIAKKAESTEVDVALTFRELRAMFIDRGISPTETAPEEFDPPRAGKGAIFPVSRGLLQNVHETDDIADGDFLVAEGRVNFRDALREFEGGNLGIHHLELLCCEGCIMGPGMTTGGKRYLKRTCISHYVNDKLKQLDVEQWHKDVEEFSDLDYSQHFIKRKREKLLAEEEDIQRVLQSMGKFEPKDHLNCGACGYDTCYEHAVAIVKGLAESEMCLPFTLDKMHKSLTELNETNERLAKTKQALKQSEKLASMGQLSAGIAHELNNPLGIITMYSNILLEESGPGNPVRKDLELIVEQTDRCRKIVGGLLNFARKNQVNLNRTNIVEFVRHSLQSVIIPDNIKVEVVVSLADPNTMIDHDQMMQVLTNLEKNAIEAMPGGGKLTITLNGSDDKIEINVADTGTGIPPSDMDKLFTPFFTTKKMGQGTGLGLPLVYGIVKMHHGQISFTSNNDPKKGNTGTEFRITLPRRKEFMIEQE